MLADNKIDSTKLLEAINDKYHLVLNLEVEVKSRLQKLVDKPIEREDLLPPIVHAISPNKDKINSMLDKINIFIEKYLIGIEQIGLIGQAMGTLQGALQTQLEFLTDAAAKKRR